MDDLLSVMFLPIAAIMFTKRHLTIDLASYSLYSYVHH